MRSYPVAPQGQPVTLESEREKLCFTLLSLGWANEKICLHTGYTDGQVNYRAKQYGLKRITYRKGQGIAEQVAQMVMNKGILNKVIRNKAARL